MSKLAVILQGDPDIFQGAFTRGGLSQSMLAGDPGFFSFIKRAISGITGIALGRARTPTTFPEGGIVRVPAGVGAASGTLAKIEAVARRHPELAAVLGAAGVIVPAVGAARVAGRVIERLRGRGAPAARADRPSRRRGKGITAAQLRGFKKVTRLLGTLGMVPRHLGHVRVQRGRRRRF